ncbi:hypothetical protein BH24CHL10_BH24CHL10_00490 [soil metagenome]
MFTRRTGLTDRNLGRRVVIGCITRPTGLTDNEGRLAGISPALRVKIVVKFNLCRACSSLAPWDGSVVVRGLDDEAHLLDGMPIRGFGAFHGRDNSGMNETGP